jgi:NADH dehydrogenase FAD-containing subunit
MGYDWLVLAAGSVNKLLPIPGVGEHAHGFRGISGLVLRVELRTSERRPTSRPGSVRLGASC